MKIKNKGRKIYKTKEKCNMKKNVIAYYANEIPIEMYDKICNFLEDDKCI